jgi:hypothetical protein
VLLNHVTSEHSIVKMDCMGVAIHYCNIGKLKVSWIEKGRYQGFADIWRPEMQEDLLFQYVFHAILDQEMNHKGKRVETFTGPSD